VWLDEREAVQEEIGLRGAQTRSYGVDPHVAIAVDVTHATDCPTIDKKAEGDVALGRGPVVFRGPNMNPHVVDRLLAAARDREIPVQLAASGRATPTDANALQVTRAGVATGLVSVPNRYMHSAVETISLADADRTALNTAGVYEALVEDIDEDGYLDVVFANYRDDSSYNKTLDVYWGSASGHSGNPEP
jgi:endoglucanase